MNKENLSGIGQWLPAETSHVEHWLGQLIREPDEELHPVLTAFKNTIEQNADVYMLFHQMFEQIPEKPPFNQTPNLKPQVRDYTHMLQLINKILTRAPEFLVIDDKPAGLIGFPINSILNWPMGTAAGFAAFLNPKVNYHFKLILNEWGRFLSSADSTSVLNDKPNGWFGSHAVKAMPNFVEEFECDPASPHYGFTSWDHFFTREFRLGQRPIEAENDNDIVNNACESKPYNLATEVKLRDAFWLKQQPYSLEHMLGGDERVTEFVGGTVYQAYLSAFAYHRWHSPVNGTIVETRVVDGTYYAEAYNQGFANDGDPDTSGPNNSQGYITSVATRALIFIECDNPDIGLVCFIAVGMSEVSTCEITTYAGRRVCKGDQIGMFHFGGSTHCLLFRRGVKLDFIHGDSTDHNIPVNAALARVQSR